MMDYELKFSKLARPNPAEVALLEYETACRITEGNESQLPPVADLSSLCYDLAYCMYQSWPELKQFKLFNDDIVKELGKLTDTFLMLYKAHEQDNLAVFSQTLVKVADHVDQLEEYEFEPQARHLIKQLRKAARGRN